MRCFIALDINKELENYLKKLQKKIPKEGKIKLVNHFHITLFFLGNAALEDVERIKKVMQEIKFKKIKARLGKIGFFPSQNYIRVIYVDVIDKDRIRELHHELTTRMENLGFKEDREFKAHITLARVKMLKNKKSFINKLKELKPENIDFEISRLTFYESILKKEGPEYKEILTIES